MSAVEQSQLFSRLSLWKDHGKAWAVLECDSFGIKHNHIKHNMATTPPGTVTNVHLSIPAEHSLRNFKPKKNSFWGKSHLSLALFFVSRWYLVSLIFGLTDLFKSKIFYKLRCSSWWDFWDCLVQGRELDSMIHGGLFQLRIFFDSVNLTLRPVMKVVSCHQKRPILPQTGEFWERRCPRESIKPALIPLVVHDSSSDITES